MKVIKVILPSTETLTIQLSVKNETNGDALLNKVYENLNIIGDSKKYFGLQYKSTEDGGMYWIRPEEKLKSHFFKTAIHFSVRICPKNPELSLTNSEARCIFRQHMKQMLSNGEIGSSNKTLAMLDSFIAQAELGCYDGHNKNYFDQLKQLDILGPTLLTTDTCISENNYLKMVQMYHKQLQGMRTTQADILFLNLVQKLPFYGLTIFQVSERQHGTCFLALSETGIHFIYDSYLERCSCPKRLEIYNWKDLLYNEIERNKIKLGFCLQDGVFIERKVKMHSKYSHAGSNRLQADLEKYKELFLDEDSVFDSRKKAQECYSTIPRRGNSWNRKMLSLRLSLRNSLKRQRNGKNKSDNEKQRIKSM